MGVDCVDWILLAHDTDQWWPVLNTVMEPQVSWKSTNISSVLHLM